MGAVRLQKKRACMAQGKKFRTVNPVYRKIYRYRLCPRNEFRRNFEFFGFKIQKFKKIHKKRKPDFPTWFCCFPVGFRYFSGGKDCFSNVKNILVYMVLQKNYYTCIYNLNTKYPFKFRKNNISLTWLNTHRFRKNNIFLTWLLHMLGLFSKTCPIYDQLV